MKKINNQYTVGIIGSGKMGTDIFNYLINYRLKKIWVISRHSSQEEVYSKFKRKIDRQLKNDLITPSQNDIQMEECCITKDDNTLKTCDLIIEAISEDINSKAALFTHLDTLIKPTCILASNTSSIKPSKLLPSLNHKNRYVSLHFFYPIKLKDIVELITANETSRDTVDQMKAFLDYIEKFYLLQTEKNNFLMNKILLEVQAEAFRIFENTSIQIEELDDIVKKKLFTQGIFEQIDHIGIDTLYYSINEYIEDYENHAKYQPMINGLKKMLKINRLGIKNNKGFYRLDNDIFDPNKLKNDHHHFSINDIGDRLYSIYQSACTEAINQNLCTKEDLNYALKQLF